MSARPEHQDIFRLREGTITVISQLLFSKPDTSPAKPVQHVEQQTRPGAFGRDRGAGEPIMLSERHFNFIQNPPPVDRFDHLVNGDDGNRLTREELPEHGHHAPIGGQSSAVHVQTAQPRHRQQGGIEYFRRRHGHDHIGRQRRGASSLRC